MEREREQQKQHHLRHQLLLITVSILIPSLASSLTRSFIRSLFPKYENPAGVLSSKRPLCESKPATHNIITVKARKTAREGENSPLFLS